MSGDVLSIIHNKLPTLSKGQRRIGEYILASYDKAAFLTASTLGKAVQVSESTVVRFACELGYEGYPQMQKALQDIVLSRLTSVQRMDVANEKLEDEDIVGAVLQGDIERLQESKELVDRRVFDSVVDALLSSQRVYVMGLRSSSALSSFLCYYLNYMLPNVRLVTACSDSEVFEQIVRISPEDAFFGISFPRYSSVTVQAMSYAKNAGAKVIALSDCPSSPLYALCEHFLPAKSDMVSLVDSLVAPLSVINALLVAIAARRRSETDATLEKLEEIWDMYHVYEKIGE